MVLSYAKIHSECLPKCIWTSVTSSAAAWRCLASKHEALTVDSMKSSAICSSSSSTSSSSCSLGSTSLTRSCSFPRDNTWTPKVQVPTRGLTQFVINSQTENYSGICWKPIPWENVIYNIHRDEINNEVYWMYQMDSLLQFDEIRGILPSKIIRTNSFPRKNHALPDFQMSIRQLVLTWSFGCYPSGWRKTTHSAATSPSFSNMILLQIKLWDSISISSIS